MKTNPLSTNTHPINYALKYPLSDKDNLIETLALLLGLSTISFLIIPLFTVNGYLLKIREQTAKNNHTLPQFDLNNWKTLTKEGFKRTLALTPLLLLTILTSIPLFKINPILTLAPPYYSHTSHPLTPHYTAPPEKYPHSTRPSNHSNTPSPRNTPSEHYGTQYSSLLDLFSPSLLSSHSASAP